MTEADVCRIYITPALKAAGWTDEQICEQVTFTAGRIIPSGQAHTRQGGKRADYLLRCTPDFPIAVVEAKDETNPPGGGLQQAMEYAETLGWACASPTRPTARASSSTTTPPGSSAR